MHTAGLEGQTTIVHFGSGLGCRGGRDGRESVYLPTNHFSAVKLGARIVLNTPPLTLHTQRVSKFSPMYFFQCLSKLSTLLSSPRDTLRITVMNEKCLCPYLTFSGPVKRWVLLSSPFWRRGTRGPGRRPNLPTAAQPLQG